MVRVLGIGGVFFKCRDKCVLSRWYEKHLGMSLNEYGGKEFDLQEAPAGSYCVWGPFADESVYFQPSDKPFMLNLIVDDLDAALAQVEKAGAELVGEPETSEFGRFGWFLDPEQNKIELWQPDPGYRARKISA